MRLRAWQNCDDLTRRMSEVELVLGERKLEKNDATMEEEGWLMFGAYFFLAWCCDKKNRRQDLRTKGGTCFFK